MFPYRLDDRTEMILMRESDAEAVLAAMMADREHLGRWLHWTTVIQSVDDALAFIRRVSAKHEEGAGFHAGLWIDGKLAGGIACRTIDRDHFKAEIGYWLSTAYTGQGLVTRACRPVIDYLFDVEHMHRIEIQAAIDNLPSRAVAERLGFTFEGVQREAIYHAGVFQDYTLYSLLVDEWK